MSLKNQILDDISAGYETITHIRVLIGTRRIYPALPGPEIYGKQHRDICGLNSGGLQLFHPYHIEEKNINLLISLLLEMSF